MFYHPICDGPINQLYSFYGRCRYGGGMPGDTAPLPVKAIQNGEIDLIGFSNGFGLNAAAFFSGGYEKIKGLGYRLQGSSKIAGNVHTGDYILDNTGVSELNFSGAIGYSSIRLGKELYVSNFKTTIGILSDSHTGNLNDLESIIENGRPYGEAGFSYDIQNLKQEVDHQLIKTKIHYHLSDGSKLNF